jgi:DNA-binding beta-propeller fold protein YncE
MAHGGQIRRALRKGGYIAIGANGDVYVTEGRFHSVMVLRKRDRRLVPVRQWGRRGHGPGEMQDPRGIVVHERQVFVVENGNHRVQVFDVKGRSLAIWGSYGRAPGQFNDPRRATVGEGLLFVFDVGNMRVQVFQLDGTITHVIPIDPDTNSFGGLLVVDKILMVEAGYHMRCFDLDGTFLTQWPLQTGFSAVAVSPSGKLLVDDDYDLVTLRLDGTEGVRFPLGEALYAFALHGNDLYVVTHGAVFIHPFSESLHDA